MTALKVFIVALLVLGIAHPVASGYVAVYPLSYGYKTGFRVWYSLFGLGVITALVSFIVMLFTL